MQWETVIGLEIHAQLLTKSKLFSGAPTSFGATPNTQACSVDLGMPGVLPVLNMEAVRMAVIFGIAIGAKITNRSIFERKNYFYPDLPKGYQISQYQFPIVCHGAVDIDINSMMTKRINVTRAHLEEDAGKSLHDGSQGLSGIDLNRAGIPLLEIVSEPEMSSAREAVAYARHIHQLVRYLHICDGNMQDGSFRCDANVSIRMIGDSKLGTRAEIKNLNSFRFIESAINYEVFRQRHIIESGGVIFQETRLYDPDRDETRSMRSKEEANDYRYFPDPDLLPVEIDVGFVDSISTQLPELPDKKRRRFSEQYGLPEKDIAQICQSRDLADYFETVADVAGDAKLAANWVAGELTAALNKDDKEIADCPVSAAQLGGLIKRIKDATISNKIAKLVFELMWDGESDADSVIEANDFTQITDISTLSQIIDSTLSLHPKEIEDYGIANDAKRIKLLRFFVGQIMKKTDGKANPQQVNDLLTARLL